MNAEPSSLLRQLHQASGCSHGEIQQLLYNRAYELSKALDAMHRACFSLKALDCRINAGGCDLDSPRDI